MTIKVNAMGDACPIPVVKTQKAMQELGGAGTVKTLVDNETAVQNLGKLAASKGCTSKTEKLGENEYRVTITVGENAKVEEQSGECYTCGKPKTVVVLSSDKMGSGNDELGGALMKAFVFALSQQETLPDTILCYNGGVKLTCLLLVAIGIANMWMGIFADVGVMVLAVLNAIRALRTSKN